MYNNINRERLLKRFIDLAMISSPSWKEEGVINYLINELASIEITCKKIKCENSYNLLLKLDGDESRQVILFSCHMDTVIPCEKVKPVINNNKIFSDGSTILGADDKAAIAVFIEAIHYIKENNIIHGPVEFLFSCAEETGLNGIKGFDLSLLRAKNAFVFDTEGRVGKVILKAPYHKTINFTVRGKAAHAGLMPEKGISAIRIASSIINRIPHGRIDNESTINVGTIKGGTATNIVAEECIVSLEIRSLSNIKLKDLERKIISIIKRVTKDNRARVLVTKTLEYSGFTINQNDKIIRMMNEALRRVKIKPLYEASGGGSDTNVLNGAGIKSVNLSIGMRNVHTKNEYVPVIDLINGTRLVLSLIDTA